MSSEPTLTIGLGGVAVSSLLLATGSAHPALALGATATGMAAPVLALLGLVGLADRLPRRWMVPLGTALVGLLVLEISRFHAEHWTRSVAVAMPASARVAVATVATVLACVLGRLAPPRAQAAPSVATAATGLRQVALAIAARALGALLMFLAMGQEMTGEIEAAAVLAGAMCAILTSIVLIGGLARIAGAMPVARGWAAIAVVLVLWPLVVHTLQAIILLRGRDDVYVDSDRPWLGVLTACGPMLTMAGFAALLRAITPQGGLRFTAALPALGVLALFTAMVQLVAEVGLEPYQTAPRDIALVLLIHLASQLVVVLPCLHAAAGLDRAAALEPPRARVAPPASAR